jgi:hypothetical protein
MKCQTSLSNLAPPIDIIGEIGGGGRPGGTRTPNQTVMSGRL